MIITLEPWEFEHAANVGTRREISRWKSIDSVHYKKEYMEDNLTANIAGAIAELCAAKAMNRYWHASVWHASEHQQYRDLPDVGTNIEVRRVRDNKYGNVAIRKSQLGRGVVVVAVHPIMPEMRTAEVFGWALQDEVWDQAKVWKEDDTMRWLPLSLLTPI